MPATAIATDLMTPDEAAAMLRVERQTLAVWRTTKRYPIPYIRVGARVMYRRADLERWIESRTVGTSDR